MSTRNCAALVLGGSPRILRKVQELGLAIVHIEDPTMVKPESAEFCQYSATQDIADVDATVAFAVELNKTWRFGAVITNHEPAIASTQAIARALGLPNSEVGTLLRDKGSVREVLEGTPLWWPWARVDSREDLGAFLKQHGLPAIAKPTTGSASLGVFAIEREGDVEPVWSKIEHLLQTGHRYSNVLPLTDYMVEKYADGPEFSVESFSIGGKHEVLAVVEKTVNEHRVEIAHTLPARISKEAKQRIESTVVEFLDLIALANGPAHTEVILDGDRVVIIESHARTGGDGISNLVAEVTGRDAEKDLVLVAAGFPLESHCESRTSAICKRFLTSRDGRVESISGLEEARALRGISELTIDVVPGDLVHEANASWWRIGEVTAVGDSPEEVSDIAEKAAKIIKIEVIN